MIIYPLISILVFSIVIFAFVQRKYLSPNLSSLVFFIISIVWVYNIGFCGDDMDTYLQFFSTYSFTNPFFFSPFEFSVGLLSSCIKFILPSSASPETIATTYRLIVFSLIPTFLILISRSNFQSSIRFISLLSFLGLFPYSFLSSSNIINNGFSLL